MCSHCNRTIQGDFCRLCVAKRTQKDNLVLVLVWAVLTVTGVDTSGAAAGTPAS